jgi:hypothetical protein
MKKLYLSEQSLVLMKPRITFVIIGLSTALIQSKKIAIFRVSNGLPFLELCFVALKLLKNTNRAQ